MGDKVRVSVLEVNGTELDYETEYDLNAALVELNPTIGGLDEAQSLLDLLFKRPNNIDGGFANSAYIVGVQCFDGGDANG